MSNMTLDEAIAILEKLANSSLFSRRYAFKIVQNHITQLRAERDALAKRVEELEK